MQLFTIITEDHESCHRAIHKKYIRATKEIKGHTFH